MKTMKKAALVIILPVLALGLSACVNLEPVQGHALTTSAEQRFTDEAINRDLAAIKDLRNRVIKVSPKAASVYAIVRAQDMVEFGAKEYGENDKTGILEPVLDDALRLLASQEQRKANIDTRLPEMPGISEIRPDIWNKIASIKQNADQLNCAGEPLAHLEIGLLELAHEQYEVDTKLNSAEHALTYLSSINPLLAKLDAALAECLPKPQVPTAAVPPLSGQRALVLGTDVLFPFDKYQESELMAAGKAKLDKFAEELLKGQALWHVLTITGHTDILGRSKYNQQLGQRRADTIRNYLVQRGLPADKITSHSQGDRQPVIMCADVKDIGQRKVCLQANRRVLIEIQ